MLDANTQAMRDFGTLDDAALVAMARQRRPEALRCIMQRHNRRLYRVARAILRDDSEAEDVVQEVYVRAFTAFAGFRGDASLATWLTRIAVNTALGRLRQQRPMVDLEVLDAPGRPDGRQSMSFTPMTSEDPDPEQAAARQQIRRFLERAIDDLMEPFRVVFVMRDVEGMSVEETAAQLGLRPETVRTRLHRARAQLRQLLEANLKPALSDAFPFAGSRCARTAEAVLRRLGLQPSSAPPKEE
jgi:RNA polymerase sigma-70 factor (ECF subfamily)